MNVPTINCREGFQTYPLSTELQASAYNSKAFEQLPGIKETFEACVLKFSQICHRALPQDVKVKVQLQSCAIEDWIQKNAKEKSPNTFVQQIADLIGLKNAAAIILLELAIKDNSEQIDLIIEGISDENARNAMRVMQYATQKQFEKAEEILPKVKGEAYQSLSNAIFIEQHAMQAERAKDLDCSLLDRGFESISNMQIKNFFLGKISNILADLGAADLLIQCATAACNPHDLIKTCLEASEKGIEATKYAVPIKSLTDSIYKSKFEAYLADKYYLNAEKMVLKMTKNSEIIIQSFYDLIEKYQEAKMEEEAKNFIEKMKGKIPKEIIFVKSARYRTKNSPS